MCITPSPFSINKLVSSFTLFSQSWGSLGTFIPRIATPYKLHIVNEDKLSTINCQCSKRLAHSLGRPEIVVHPISQKRIPHLRRYSPRCLFIYFTHHPPIIDHFNSKKKRPLVVGAVFPTSRLPPPPSLCEACVVSHWHGLLVHRNSGPVNADQISFTREIRVFIGS